MPNWGMNAALRIAEEMNVQLEHTPNGYVREVGDAEHVRWVRMYQRLYQRKRYRERKEEKRRAKQVE